MKALITGVCGQDGFYLSELLLSKGYEVVGTRRRLEEPRDEPPGVKVVFGDITDAGNISRIIYAEEPDEVYNLAALTNVGDSFLAPTAFHAVNAIGAINVIEAAAYNGSKFYQASTSELFGASPPPQNEDTPMAPRSPYGISKLAAYWTTRNWRERGLYAVNGILFNHESPRRKPAMVTQKVTRAVAAIVRREQDHVVLGNLDSCRDWGHPKDYVRGMWMMMQQDKPDDYVLATGVMHSVRELCEVAFGYAGLDYKKYVRSDPALYRPLEVERLCGDAAKANALGWKPEIPFEDIIREMIEANGCTSNDLREGCGMRVNPTVLPVRDGFSKPNNDQRTPGISVIDRVAPQNAT